MKKIYEEPEMVYVDAKGGMELDSFDSDGENNKVKETRDMEKTYK